MPRFFLSPESFVDDHPELSPEESHHCAHVLRAKPGQKITVFDGQGSEAQASIEEIADTVRLRMGSRVRQPTLRCEITLAQAIPKGKNMDLIVQKAVELGAARIAPILSDRTVVQIEKEDLEKKRQRWEQTALEACKQCGRNLLPEILPPSTIKDFLASDSPGELPLIASLQPDSRHIKDILEEIHSEGGSRPEAATIFVGPEGDFTPAETSLAISAGFRPVTLGPVILRSETAAIYCLSVLAHELF